MLQVLQEETSNIGGLQQEVRRAQQDMLSSRRLEESQQQLQQQRLAEAEARLKKARLIVQGPPVPQVTPDSTPEMQLAVFQHPPVQCE